MRTFDSYHNSRELLQKKRNNSNNNITLCGLCFFNVCMQKKKVIIINNQETRLRCPPAVPPHLLGFKRQPFWGKNEKKCHVQCSCMLVGVVVRVTDADAADRCSFLFFSLLS